MFRTMLLGTLAALLLWSNSLAAASKLEVTSSAFAEGKPIPKKYTGDGKNVSPPLRWTKIPEGTKTIAVICDDPDAPKKVWVHWVLFNLPADTKQLAEAMPRKKTLSSGARQGTNDMDKIGYRGPAPPKGKPHRYYFKVYALDRQLKLKAGATKKKLETAMKGHILAEGRLMGKYGR